MPQIRTANAHWEGALTTGNGTVEAGTGLFGPLPLTWRARAEASDTGMTSPEELGRLTELTKKANIHFDYLRRAAA